ncbi:MAG: hypothetical protein KGZ74_00615 [Chitinophagaceae bacterium]|nr:hypothetical protein [Chitinophagaceae bacterium]
MKELKQKKEKLEKDIENLLNDFVKEFPDIDHLEFSSQTHFQAGKIIHITVKVNVAL